MENKDLIDKAIVFIQENHKDNLSLKSIADNAGFSLNYFDAIFRQHTGYSPKEYSRVYKLTRSALELRKTQKTVLDIALDFGYASPESYTRAFKSFYGITPSEYREKNSKGSITWHDLSGRIAISRFKRNFPELKVSDLELALDYCFTHNPVKYGEDLVGMTVAETEILTLGAPERLEHFVYVSDYNSFDPLITLVCEKEEDALSYLMLFAKQKNLRFSIRKSVDSKWGNFDAEVAKAGLTCRSGYDMLFVGDNIDVPQYDGLSARVLNDSDMNAIKAFKQIGGCAECHVQAIQIRFDGKGNDGLVPMGVFEKGELVCLAMPTLDKIRDFRKYDIGAIFVKTEKEEKVVDLIWKYAVDYCLNDKSYIGNANAMEEIGSPLDVGLCERMGFKKVAKNCVYQK